MNHLRPSFYFFPQLSEYRMLDVLNNKDNKLTRKKQLVSDLYGVFIVFERNKSPNKDKRLQKNYTYILKMPVCACFDLGFYNAYLQHCFSFALIENSSLP